MAVKVGPGVELTHFKHNGHCVCSHLVRAIMLCVVSEMSTSKAIQSCGIGTDLAETGSWIRFVSGVIGCWMKLLGVRLIEGGHTQAETFQCSSRLLGVVVETLSLG